MRVILTENQIRRVIKEETAAGEITQQLSTVTDPNVILNFLSSALKTGAISFPTVPVILMHLLNQSQNGQQEKQSIFQRLKSMFTGNNIQQPQENMEVEQNDEGVWQNKFGNWKLVSDDTLATVYNAVPQQCNNDVVHTASMFKLNLSDVLSQKVIAMERTFMKELGLKYGDVVYVEGTQKWDGPWQIQDTMNKRFAGMHKIDILVPRNIRAGKWEGVKISVPADEKTAMNAKSTMRGSA